MKYEHVPLVRFLWLKNQITVKIHNITEDKKIHPLWSHAALESWHFKILIHLQHENALTSNHWEWSFLSMKISYLTMRWSTHLHKSAQQIYRFGIYPLYYFSSKNEWRPISDIALTFLSSNFSQYFLVPESLSQQIKNSVTEVWKSILNVY